MANISPDLSSRRDTIANYVIMHGDISVEELADTCGVSVMTIYRDISVLEKAGIVHREHGRIRATASGLHEATAQYRMAQGVEEKKQMGKAAAALIPASASVIIDDSTSAIWAIRQLEQTSGLSVSLTPCWWLRSCVSVRRTPCSSLVANIRAGQRLR